MSLKPTAKGQADGSGEAFPKKKDQPLEMKISAGSKALMEISPSHLLSSQPLTLQVIGTGAGAGGRIPVRAEKG
jgi:hypothetical protein